MIQIRDVVKFIPLVLVAASALYVSPNLPVFLEALGLLALFGVASHFLRKIILWGHSLDDLYKKAAEEPMAAAVVYASVIYFISQCLISVFTYLK